MTIPYGTYQDTTFDARFNDEQQYPHIRAIPWVGKHYQQIRVMVLGADDKHSREIERGCRYPSEIVTGCWDPSREPFVGPRVEKLDAVDKMVLMFLAKRDTVHRRKFWEAVAFNNFKQSENPNSNKLALEDTLKILQPELVIYWGTEIWNLGLSDWQEGEKIGGDKPRWVMPTDATPAVVGIKHPGGTGGFSPSAWLKFLQECEASRDAVAGLLNHLQTV